MKKIIMLLAVLSFNAFATDTVTQPLQTNVNLSIDNTVSSQASVMGTGTADSTAQGWNYAKGYAIATPTSISGEALTAQGGSVVSTQTGAGVSGGTVVERAIANVSASNPHLEGSAQSLTNSSIPGNGSFNSGTDSLFVGTIAPIAGGAVLSDSKLTSSWAEATNATTSTSGFSTVSGVFSLAPVVPVQPVRCITNPRDHD